MEWVKNIFRKKKQDKLTLVNSEGQIIGYAKPELFKGEVKKIPKKEYNLRG